MLSKAYDPGSTEDRIYRMWEESGVFTGEAKSKKEPFSIAMPPPNATGNLHLGHAVMLALEDIFIRFHRMRGKEVLWLPGTDHAAIATENVVIKQLQERGIRDPRAELGRDGLIAKIATYVEESRSTIQTQVRKMGASCDWSRERYTFEPALNRVVNEVFKEMYEDGLIYRGHRIVNWDPVLQTTVSDDEVDWVEEQAPFYTFQYGPFRISTARPETKFGDKYVVVHPDDARYTQYKHGETFECEWINGRVRATVIKDTAVDPTFGTGVMTITPWHDAADFEIAERHGLEKEQIIGFDGRLLPVAGAFAGVSIEDARPLIVEQLRRKGLLVKVDAAYVHRKAISQRGGGAIEPQIKLQWFVDVNKEVVPWKGQTMSLKQVMHDVVHHGDIMITPDRFEKTYFHWIDNLRDWCISRQIWWGHRVPVYYCTSCERSAVSGQLKAQSSPLRPAFVKTTAGKQGYEGQAKLKADGKGGVIVSVQTLTRCPACGGAVEQDPDTLDTWFSSALWTWSTLIDRRLTEDPSLSLEEMLRRSPDFQTFHPTSVMETGYDILFFWVARMILMTTYTLSKLPELRHEQRIPFRTVYLHGLIRTRDGRKMSKSDPETMIDPLDMIEKYGADALRLSMIVGQSPGADSRLYEEKIAGYRNFVNKLWNASRFVLMQCEQAGVDPATIKKLSSPSTLSLADRAILHALELLIEDVTKGLKEYCLSDVGERLYSFTWGYFCDWYLELSKGNANADVLVHTVRRLLKLLHPYCPFVTEELWAVVKAKDAGMLIVEEWPSLRPERRDQVAFAELQVVIDVITAIRRLRADQSVEHGREVAVTLVTAKHGALLESQEAHIRRLANVRGPSSGSGQAPSSGSGRGLTIETRKFKPAENMVSAFLPDIEVHLSLAGLVDPAKERASLEKECARLRRYIAGIEGKLQNSDFVERAPARLVAGEREKLKTSQERLGKVEERLRTIG